MLSGRPLLDNAVDAELLLDRHVELDALERAITSRFNVLLAGPAGSGRTTTLHALARRLRTTRRRTDRRQIAYTRVEAALNPTLILDAVTGSLATARQPASGDFEQALARLGEVLAASDPVPVLAVDDVPSSAGHTLFGTARDLLWELPVTWIVAVRDPHAAALLAPPADAFFEQRVTLDALTGDQARELVRRRVPDMATDWVQAVLDAGGGTPRAVLEGARAVSASGADSAALADIYRGRAAALTALGRPAQMAAAALDSLGSAASSDRALLDQLGWTRARAVQVLGQLEVAGLVGVDMVSTGRGRPRKVYRLNGP